MGWIRVDDQFDDHPKMAAVGPLGWALWLSGLAYCNRNLTDGFIPWSAARKLVTWEFLGPEEERGRRVYRVTIGSGMMGDNVDSDFVIDLLLDAGVWNEVDGGYAVHDYADYQPLKAEVERRRDLKTERQRRWRESRDASRDADVDASTDATVDASVDASVDGLKDAPETLQPKPNPKKRKDPLTRDNKVVDASTDTSTEEQPFNMFVAFCEEVGADPSGATTKTKDRQCAVARQLLDDGHSIDDVRAFLRYLKSQTWRTGTIDLRTVASEIGEWKLNGRPESEAAVKEQRNGGKPKTREERAWEEHMAKTRAKDANVF